MKEESAGARQCVNQGSRGGVNHDLGIKGMSEGARIKMRRGEGRAGEITAGAGRGGHAVPR